TILAKLTSFEEILTMIGVVAGIYFIICFSLSMLVRYYAKKTAYIS
ncbi:amino acid ABC transporter permease, partial [Campylobacter jejuni]|nr:amino acid ABC transporter permease [Campylobacter jejuni]